MRQYMAERRVKRRNQLIELSGGKCQQCGALENLEFDHRDRAEKKFTLSGAPLDRAWTTILEEHAKCDLLCKTCHLQHTAKQWADGELQAHNKGISRSGEVLPPYVHGTMRRYQEKECRCEHCRAAKKAYRAKRITYHEILDLDEPRARRYRS